MRAKRLPQILTNNKLIVLDCDGNYQTDWDLQVFAREFPSTEIISLYPLKKNTMLAYVYADTAKAISEGRYDDARLYSKTIEHHNFD